MRKTTGDFSQQPPRDRQSYNPNAKIGNFFQTSAIEGDTANGGGGPLSHSDKRTKRKNSEMYQSNLQQQNLAANHTVSNVVQGAGSGNIKKMIENSWKAVQSQQMSQSFY